MSLTPVPGHINSTTGRFCQREGLLTEGGHCPDGCDHAARGYDASGKAVQS